MTSACKRYQKVAYTVTGRKTALFTRLRCKQWSCDYCAAKNASSWQYWLIKKLPDVSQEWWLVTLTANSKTRTMLASFLNLRDNLEALFKRIRRVFGHIEYVRVFERHPTSEAIHVHIVITGLAPWVVLGASVKHRPMAIGVLKRPYRDGCHSVLTWLKDTCYGLGMGYIADVRPFNGPVEKVAFYVTKYLTKSQQDIDIKGLRHVQVTAAIGKPEFDKNYTWTPVSYITSRTFDEPNTEVTDIDTGFVIDNNYWEHTGFYPNE